MIPPPPSQQQQQHRHRAAQHTRTDTHERLVAQWTALLSTFAHTPTVAHSLRQMEQLILTEGIPDGPFRARIWLMISGAAALAARNAAAYAALTDALRRTPPVADLERIRMDAARLRLPADLSDDNSNNGLVDDAVRLTALYCLHDARVGYIQGMLYVAVLLAAVIADEAARFWLLTALMSDYGLRAILDPASPTLYNMMGRLSALVDDQAPALARHLNAQGAAPSLYAVECFSSCFVACMPLPTVLRVWDLLLMHVDHVMERVLAALLTTHQDELLCLASLDDLLPLLKHTIATAPPSIVLQLVSDPAPRERSSSCVLQ